jgi:hypothetical protein
MKKIAQKDLFYEMLQIIELTNWISKLLPNLILYYGKWSLDLAAISLATLLNDAEPPKS